ncbi:hypothetical protein [Nocardia suismassiliense]|uniref:hypothetical protein n=1 Tax=Nocardia suismassiliense TaxID=2077092 RepID=UPI00131F2E69|nr:hypothetical protein [Nocardia suismassiliense]
MKIDISCPRCGDGHGVQSVPAAHAEGVSTSYGTDLTTGVGISPSGLMPILGTTTVERTHTTALARSLSMAPAQRPVGRLLAIGLVLLIPDLLALAVLALALQQPDEVGLLATLFGAVFFLGALAIPSTIAFCIAIGRARFNTRVSRGRRAAHVVWSSALYCHRCGMAFWPFSPAPNIPAHQAFPPENFRWFVWHAGDYVDA